MKKGQKIILVLLISAHILILISGVFFMFVDGDEGGILVLSREVINGRIPVLEINAHNQPLLYYSYGLWMKIFGFGIVAGRSLSVLAMFIAGLLLLWWAYRFSGNYWVSVILYFFYITNLTFFKANVPVKPFALSNIFIFASFALLTGRYIKDRTLKSSSTLFFSGLLLGISLGVRLMFILPVVFVIWLLFVMLRDGVAIRDMAKKAAFFCLGVITPLLPSIVLFIKDPFMAYTMWVGAYAQIYLGKGNNPDFMKNVLSDIKTDLMINSLLDMIRVYDIVFLVILIFISTISFFLWGRNSSDKVKGNVYTFIWLIFGGIALVCSNLFVSYMSYVNQLVLFAILLTLPLFEEISRRTDVRKLMAYLSLLIVAVMVIMYVKINNKVRSYMLSEDLVITPGVVNSISDEVIKKLTKEDDVIFDNMGMFVFASGRKPLKGFEYPTDIPIYWNFMPVRENASKYLYISETELLEKLKKKEIPLVILGDDTELVNLVSDKRLTRTWGPNKFFREEVEKNYDLHKKYFLKPINFWVLIYIPRKSLS